MSLLELAALAVLQGTTEFLPISSSGHLVLARWLFGWQDPGLAFDIALHMGTLAAVLAYFHKDWLRLGLAFFRDPRHPDARLAWLVALATIPGALAGALLESTVEGYFRHPAPIAVFLILMGLVLLAAPRLARRQKGMIQMTPRDALVVGVAQAASVFPGFSRSGTSMAAARALGLSAEGAARFSFLLAVPLIAGAGLYEGLQVLRDPAEADWANMALGALIAGIVGFLSIAWLLRILRRVGFVPFVVYRLVVGVAVLAAVALGIG